jgi:hypothetical protein
VDVVLPSDVVTVSRPLGRAIGESRQVGSSNCSNIRKPRLSLRTASIAALGISVPEGYKNRDHAGRVARRGVLMD